jgi:exopolyphosphatase/guanosine-5'-triphosphate,3'-diphosphate pyrophosphatase
MDQVQSIKPERLFGIVDCGTNTFNLLIGKLVGDQWELLFSNKMPVKIGSGGFESQQIMPDRMARGLDVVDHYQRVCKNFGVRDVYVFATSALRDAENAKEFVQKVKFKNGWTVNIISGDEEAALIFEGVRKTKELSNDSALIMDIGGGSTEFIIVQKGKDVWKRSYPLGVSRLFERIQPQSRISQQDLQALKKILQETTTDLSEALQKLPCDILIGSSGSFDTLLALYNHSIKNGDELNEDICQEIPMGAFSSIHMQMMGSTLEERLKNPAIPTIRAEYMPLSTYLVRFVLEMHPFKSVWRSPYALKEGVIFSKIMKQS